MRVWDAATGAPLGEPLSGHTDFVTAVALGRADDHDVIVSGGEDGTVWLWNATTGRCEAVLDMLGEVAAVALNETGLFCAAVGWAICTFAIAPTDSLP